MTTTNQYPIFRMSRALSSNPFSCVTQISHAGKDTPENSKPINSNLFSRKFQWYDKIFLNVLYYDNKLGEAIFSKFYRKNDINLTFKFLDEKTSILEDFKIIWSLTSFAFVKALFR